ncbi:MAG TPA: hypothetical protein PLT61_01725 [Acinetobacter johnsonii]|jgi:hypothetical protein|nr:hypothetical protein [Acinetobacter johnsonii]
MTKLLKTNEEIVLYRNALERKNFTRIESAIQDELEQLAELHVDLKIITKQSFDIKKQNFTGVIQIFGEPLKDKLGEIEQRISEIRHQIKKINQNELSS